MDKTINVTVLNKTAMADGTTYICGNSDFTVEFEFDREWDAYEFKTARFIYGNSHIDLLFSGNTCRVPVLSNINNFKIGVFAGALSTSTPAIVYAKKSILCGSGSPKDPSQDVYNQILELLNGLDITSEEEIKTMIEEYLADHPSGEISGECATDEEVLALLKDTV